MHEKKSFAQRADEFLSGKGFYIVLFVCVAVIGVSAWLLLFSQYSPLTPGDAGDYLDVMGDVAGASNPTDLKGKDNEDETQKADPPKEDDQPEHQTPEEPTDPPEEPNEPGENTLTVEDKPDGKPTEDESPEDEPENESGPTSVLTAKDITFIWPVNGTVTMDYSPASLIYDKTMGDWRTHDGVDLAVTLGTKVMSAANGTVVSVSSDDRYGTTVVIDHGAGVVTTYANMAGTPTVEAGDAVTMGSVIGSVGTTALFEAGDTPHLHFSMTVDGVSADPTEYLPRR